MEGRVGGLLHRRAGRGRRLGCNPRGLVGVATQHANQGSSPFSARTRTSQRSSSAVRSADGEDRFDPKSRRVLWAGVVIVLVVPLIGLIAWLTSPREAAKSGKATASSAFWFAAAQTQAIGIPLTSVASDHSGVARA